MSTDPDPKAARDLGPAVPFPPPLLFVGGLALGLLLDHWFPLAPVRPDTTWPVVVGLISVAAGLGMMVMGILTFRRFRTAVYPNRPAKLIVDTGVYAYTRNPMYLGMTIVYLGAVLLTGAQWILLLLPLVLLLLMTQVIHREERHLRERFPEAYAAYCANVRRWF